MIAKHQRLLGEISAPTLKIGLALPPEYIKGGARNKGSKNKKTIQRESETQRRIKELQRKELLEQIAEEHQKEKELLKQQQAMTHEPEESDEEPTGISQVPSSSLDVLGKFRSLHPEQEEPEEEYYSDVGDEDFLHTAEPEAESLLNEPHYAPKGIIYDTETKKYVRDPIFHYEQEYNPSYEEEEAITEQDNPEYFSMRKSIKGVAIPDLESLYGEDGDPDTAQQFLDQSDDEPDDDYTGIMNETVKQAVTNDLVNVSTELSKLLAKSPKTFEDVKKIRELTRTQKRLTTLLGQNEKKKVKEYYANSYPDLSGRFNRPQFFPKKYNRVQPPLEKRYFPRLDDAVLKFERMDVNGFSDYDFTHSKIPINPPMPYIPTQALNTVVSAPIDKLPNVKLSVKHSKYVHPSKTPYDTLMDPIDKLPLR